MSPFFDDLESQLRSAARSRAGASATAGNHPPRHRRRPAWLRAGITAAPVLAALLVTLAVVAGALVLLGRHGHGGASGSRPPSGGIGALIAHTPQPQLRRELAYMSAAARRVQSSKACRLQQPAGVTYTTGSPGPDLLSVLGVLRRPANPADRYNPSGLGPVPGVYRADIRRAFAANGASYYIVPARYDRAASTPSNRCLELQANALNRGLAKIPASMRTPTRELQAAIIAWLEKSAASAPRDTICFVAVSGNSTGAGCGATAEEIKAGESASDNQGTYSGVVPDGVATVTLILPATTGHPARPLTTSVIGNVYAVHVNQPPLQASRTYPTVIWRSARGRVLKRISPPSNPAAERARVCNQEPIPCLLLEAGTSQTTSTSGTETRAARTR